MVQYTVKGVLLRASINYKLYGQPDGLQVVQPVRVEEGDNSVVTACRGPHLDHPVAGIQLILTTL